jgi:hypothetical protein
MREFIVGFRLNRLEKRLLDEAAKKMECSISDAIRWALRCQIFLPQEKHAEWKSHR